MVTPSNEETWRGMGHLLKVIERAVDTLADSSHPARLAERFFTEMDLNKKVIGFVNQRGVRVAVQADGGGGKFRVMVLIPVEYISPIPVGAPLTTKEEALRLAKDVATKLGGGEPHTW